MQLHMNAFSYFNGHTDTILYDNLKQVVLERKPSARDSTFNSQFMDFLEYYGIVPRLCRPYRAQTKGKVERTISFIGGTSGTAGHSHRCRTSTASASTGWRR